MMDVILLLYRKWNHWNYYVNIVMLVFLFLQFMDFCYLHILSCDIWMTSYVIPLLFYYLRASCLNPVMHGGIFHVTYIILKEIVGNVCILIYLKELMKFFDTSNTLNIFTQIVKFAKNKDVKWCWIQSIRDKNHVLNLIKYISQYLKIWNGLFSKFL